MRWTRAASKSRFREAQRIRASTPSLEDRIRACSKSFLEEVSADLGQAEARFKYAEKGNIRTLSGERKAGIDKRWANLYCFTTTDFQEMEPSSSTVAPGKGPRGFYDGPAWRAGGHLPHHLAAGTCARTPAVLAAQWSGCGRERPPGKREGK